MIKTYKGSCHCGAVRFEADLDLSAGSGKCNCSYCSKSRNWSVLIKPEAFRLLAGEDALSDYQFNTKTGHHLFCRQCGIHSFSRGNLKELGGAFVSVQLMSLDNASPQELLEGPIGYANGRDNAWWEAPVETRHL